MGRFDSNCARAMTLPSKFSHDVAALVRNEEQIGLNNQRALGIEDDIEWRQPHLAEPPFAHVLRERKAEIEDDRLVTRERRLGDAQDSVNQLRGRTDSGVLKYSAVVIVW